MELFLKLKKILWFFIKKRRPDGDSRMEGKEFSVTKVTHSLGSGYVVGVEFEG